MSSQSLIHTQRNYYHNNNERMDFDWKCHKFKIRNTFGLRDKYFACTIQILHRFYCSATMFGIQEVIYARLNGLNHIDGCFNAIFKYCARKYDTKTYHIPHDTTRIPYHVHHTHGVPGVPYTATFCVDRFHIFFNQNQNVVVELNPLKLLSKGEVSLSSAVRDILLKKILAKDST